MNVRDLKLAIACGKETDDVISLNKFFDDLFSGLTIYTKNDKPDLFFMKGEKFIMEQDLEIEVLWCRYDEFWSILEDRYRCEYEEIQDLIQYKVEEVFKSVALTPGWQTTSVTNGVEEVFKSGALTPLNCKVIGNASVEEVFKSGALTPRGSSMDGVYMVEEDFKNGALTPYTKTL